MFGVAGTVSRFMGDRARTTLSDANASISYTTKKTISHHIQFEYFLLMINGYLKGTGGIWPVITSHYAYSYLYGYDTTKYAVSGISFDACYDSRDNPVFPTQGSYAVLSFRYHPTFLGSSKNSTLLWLEYRDYINLSSLIPRHLIGIWL